jgi:3-isopropylmalate/(R)-2-methylmalate dehydratase small subunit
MRIQGRIWKFGDHIDTDQMMPPDTFRLPLPEQARSLFRTLRPGWVNQVEKGDIILGGKNFGVGSSRPAARALKFLGIEAVLAESINGLFFKNCINYGLPAFNLPGAAQYFQEGERAEINVEAGTIKNLDTAICLQVPMLPGMLIDILKAGGIVELLQQEGYLARAGEEKEEGG